MTEKELDELASTKRKGLPEKNQTDGTLHAWNSPCI